MGEGLTLIKWGPGITDVRNLSRVNFLTKHETGTPNNLTLFDQASAEKALAAAIAAAPPGVLFQSNPHYGIYAKWDNLFVKAGFRPVSKFCAINQVYNTDYSWRGKQFNGAKPTQPWESPDGYTHWIHAMYLVKEPVPTKMAFDFTEFDGKNGCTDQYSRWAVGYGGRKKPSKQFFEESYARISHNCGCAMGFGKPKGGELVDGQFYTVQAVPADKLLPEGYTRFLTAGGLKFGHNLKKLVGDTATECFHKFDVL